MNPRRNSVRKTIKDTGANIVRVLAVKVNDEIEPGYKVGTYMDIFVNTDTVEAAVTAGTPSKFARWKGIADMAEVPLVFFTMAQRAVRRRQNEQRKMCKGRRKKVETQVRVVDTQSTRQSGETDADRIAHGGSPAR